jgi:hypothetical protein
MRCTCRLLTRYVPGAVHCRRCPSAGSLPRGGYEPPTQNAEHASPRRQSPAPKSRRCACPLQLWSITDAVEARIPTIRGKPALQELVGNLKPGITVSLVSLPLSISLAIAADATPVQGIITAAWAGLVASIFGGSHYNIVGPTGTLQARACCGGGEGGWPVDSRLPAVRCRYRAAERRGAARQAKRCCWAMAREM